MYGWLNSSLKRTETRDELSITLYLQYEINLCSVRMPVDTLCYIPTSLPPEPSSIFYYLELNSTNRPLASHAETGL